MRIVCIGGGPAGLYFALLMKKLRGAHDVTVIERNRPSDTFGWGVVFSDQTLDNLARADAPTASTILSSFNHWDDIDVHFKGRIITSSGHGFCGIGRQRLLNILQDRCRELGVALVFETEVADPVEVAARYTADLVVAADGINSRVRARYEPVFRPEVDLRRCRFVWLGTDRRFDAFTFAFEETAHGWFQAHAYRYDDTTSTFIVETPEEVWRAAGIDRMAQDEGIVFCERLFARHLDGHRLMSNAPHLRGAAIWIRFPRVVCATWRHRLRVQSRDVPLVLMGDAAHTAHFSVGSGTKLALEDAIELAQCFADAGERPSVPDVLARYETARSVEVLKIQNAARNSTEWFENVGRYTALEAEQFAYSLLTRSQRISHENLRLRDREYVESFERWLAARAWRQVHGGIEDQSRTEDRGSRIESNTACEDLGLLDPKSSILDSRGRVASSTEGAGFGPLDPQSSSLDPKKKPPPPMLTPFRLRGVTLANRIVVSPMDMYSAVNGVAGDFHLVHLGARALGGAALVFTEMTCVAPDARISLGCAGLWNTTQRDAWRRIVDFVHAHSNAKIALQLGHCGPKGSTQFGWEQMDEPLASGNWPLIAPSALAYGPNNQMPRAMTRADMARVLAEFERAAKYGADAGFDWLELHCAHGYLLSAFLSPLTNRRDDEYGGSLENRCRYPLDVFRALRAIWPQHLPMSVRISAHDWAPGGNTPDEAVVIARLFQQAGADLIDVSSGQTTREAKPVYGRMYQTPFADRIRNEVGIATMAVGAIFEADHANSIIAAGRADLCALARPHLADAAWTLHEAAQLGVTDLWWPKQYLQGKAQLERNLERERQLAVTNAGLTPLQRAVKALES